VNAPAAASLKVGGTVGFGELYIERTQDRQVYERLAAGEFCNILTSRQMGKSSLMVRVSRRLQQEKRARISNIDMAGDLGTPRDADAWYVGILDKVALDLGVDEDVETWWTEKGRGTANQRLLQFFREVVKAETDRPVYVFLDEVDATLKLDYRDDLFTAIRTVYNQRSTVAEYRGLTFCLVGVFSPDELVKDRRTTPYNIAHTVELRDFDPTLDDLKPLYAAMTTDDVPGELLVRAVLAWTGGQPFLTVAMCAMARTRGVRTAAEVDAMVNDVNANDLVRTHLETISTFLATRIQNESATLRLYSAVLRGKKIRDKVSPAHIGLRLSGLIKRAADGNLVLRNRIYARRFNRNWLSRTRPMVAQRRLIWIAIAFCIVVAGSAVTWAYTTREARERARVLDDLLAKLADAPSEPVARNVLGEICDLVPDTDDPDRKRALEAWTKFMTTRADKLEILANDARAAGLADSALILGALAGLKRGKLSPGVRGAYESPDPLVGTLRRHNGRVDHVRFLDEDRIVSIGLDDTIRVFSLIDGAELHYTKQDGLSDLLEVCPDGTCIATVSRPRSLVQFWTTALAELSSVAIDEKTTLDAFAFSRGAGSPMLVALVAEQRKNAADQGFAVVGRVQEGVTVGAVVQDRQSFAHVPVGYRGRVPVETVTFSADGTQLITAAWDGVRAFDLAKPTAKPVRIGPEGNATDARISADGSKIAIAVNPYTADARAQLHLGTAPRPNDAAEPVSMVYEASGAWVSTFAGADHGVAELRTSAFSPSGTHVVNAAIGTDGASRAIVWRIKHGEVSDDFVLLKTPPITDAAFGPGEKGLVATAHEDGTIQIWATAKTDRARVDDVAAVWTAVQRKLGYTVDDSDTVIDLGPEGVRELPGIPTQAELCTLRKDPVPARR
jgi:WD40 repeat protein